MQGCLLGTRVGRSFSSRQRQLSAQTVNTDSASLCTPVLCCVVHARSSSLAAAQSCRPRPFWGTRAECPRDEGSEGGALTAWQRSIAPDTHASQLQVATASPLPMSERRGWLSRRRRRSDSMSRRDPCAVLNLLLSPKVHASRWLSVRRIAGHHQHGMPGSHTRHLKRLHPPYPSSSRQSDNSPHSRHLHLPRVATSKLVIGTPGGNRCCTYTLHTAFMPRT